MKLNRTNILILLKQTFAVAVISTALTFSFAFDSAALTNNYCKTPDQSLSCKIAYNKIKETENPLNGLKFFDDKLHFWGGGNLVLNPTYYIAEEDLNADGINEIIAGLPEAAPHVDASHKRLFCQKLPQYKEAQCPHFIFHDRNMPEPLIESAPQDKEDKKTPNLKGIYTFGPYYYHVIGTVLDDSKNEFKTLRGYKDGTWEHYDVLQYDAKTDKYYRIPSLSTERKVK